MLSGQVVQFEGTLIYAFYGGVSYEVNPRKTHEAVPLTDLQATANAASTHMDISQPAGLKPEKQALVSVARPLVDSGDLHPAKVADWVKTGAAAIEGATGSSIGELIGEGQLIVNWEANPEDVAPLVHAHPTQNEAVGEAFLALAGKPLHAHA